MPKLTATLAESKKERQRQWRKSHREKRLAAGLCIVCGKGLKKPDAQRCRPCTVKQSEAYWRWNQSRLKGGRKTRTAPVVGWNFSTDDLITEHVSLAKKMAHGIAARQFSSSTVDVDELIGDAMLGLVVAGRTFDESYGKPFGAWATTQIRGEIYAGIRRWTKCRHQDKPTVIPLDEAEEHDWDDE